VAIAAWVNQLDLQRFWPERDWSLWIPRTMVFESTSGSTLPCKFLGHKVAGVQAHTICEWVNAYPGHVYHMPLVTSVTGSESERLTDHLLTLLRKGTPYDLGGALLAGTFVTKYLPCVAQWVDDRQSRFCVETAESAILSAFLARQLPPLDPGRDRPRDMVRKARRSKLWSKPRKIK
jgi:hypothetical protein